jgi:hypothetical protein
MESNSPAAPIACLLSQEAVAGRVRRWRSLAERALVSVVGTRDGLRLSFASTPGVEAEVRDLAGLELECCAFASWTVHAIDDTVVLDVSGKSPQAVTAVQDLFTDLRGVTVAARRDGGCPA